jgi:chemosensory pili system protein ChpA (sensor histidine kinase/response regulator)
VKQVGELEIPLPLYNIYLHETDELVRLLAQDFGEWRHEPRPVNPQALQAAHTWPELPARWALLPCANWRWH